MAEHSAVKAIGHEEVLQLMDAGAQVVDVLPPEDYARLHLPGAINLPLSHFSDETLTQLDRERPVVVYCADNECDLSPRAAARLAAEGFAEVYDYVASLADWGAFGLPLEGEDADIPTNRDLARRDVPTCRMDERVEALADRFGEHSVCAVVDGSGVLLGRLRGEDVRNHTGSVRDAMHPGPSTFRPDVTNSEMAEWFEKRRDTDEFIITTLDGRLFGVLYREDVEQAVHEAH
ncbi:MAG: rhodanese-like domain-containing protein [Dehalococcoidia bacterium]